MIFEGRVSNLTEKPWFIDVISTFPFSIFFTGWFAPWCPWCILNVLPPRAKARIWCPKQIPKIGISIDISSLIIGIAYFPVARGSPGPLDRKIPFGFKLAISDAFVLHDTIVILLNLEERHLKILFFTP